MKSLSQSAVFKLSIVSSALLIIYFIFTSQFWAHWWFIFIPVGLGAILFHIIIMIKCVVFWAKYSGEYSQPHIPFSIVVLSILITYGIPSHNKSKHYYIGSGKLFNYKSGNCKCDLSAEYYCASKGGYMATDLNAEYLTDSISFRK